MKKHTLGRRHWAIAEGYIPGESPPASADRRFVSHETACILNAGDRDAHVELRVYFASREPAGPFRLVVPARRTLHMRFDELSDPERLPRETDFSSAIDSDEPIVVQHTRLDARPQQFALLSAAAYSED